MITSAGNLNCRYVIHTVGPVWRDGNNREKEKLVSCYNHSLKLAVENEIRSIAFPNISTGIYGFPKDQAAIIAIETVQAFLVTQPIVEKVIFVCYDARKSQALFFNNETLTSTISGKLFLQSRVQRGK